MVAHVLYGISAALASEQNLGFVASIQIVVSRKAIDF